jgi:fluoride exporter
MKRSGALVRRFIIGNKITRIIPRVWTRQFPFFNVLAKGFEMNPLIPVMAGGAIGAALRFLVSSALPSSNGWPWGTFAANVIGGFVMGLLASVVLRGQASESVRLFLGVGVLGGFTTFSAFSLESFAMIERGEWVLAGGYTFASVIGSIAALALGFNMVRA